VLLWQFGIELLEAERRMCNAAEIAFERMQLHEWLIAYFEAHYYVIACLPRISCLYGLFVSHLNSMKTFKCSVPFQI
jgi:hypothetical protein